MANSFSTGAFPEIVVSSQSSSAVLLLDSDVLITHYGDSALNSASSMRSQRKCRVNICRQWEAEKTCRSEHHQLDLAVLNESAFQTIAGHLLDSRPVLAEIFHRFFLCRQLCRYAAGLSLVSVRNLEKDDLMSLFEVVFGRHVMTSHGCS